MIDAKAGLMPDDRTFAEIVRRSGKPVVLVANKAEARGAEAGMLEAWELGLGEPVADLGRARPGPAGSARRRRRSARRGARLRRRRGRGRRDRRAAKSLIGEDIADPGRRDRPMTTPSRCASPSSAGRTPASRR